MSTAKYRYLAVGYCLLIILVSSIPGRALENFKLMGWDKLLHFVEYGLLGWLFVHSLEHRDRALVSVVIVAGILFGAFDELWQLFASGRSASVYDWFADALGVGAGGVIGLFMMNRHHTSVSGKSS